jgi:hypothetical protein|uniref:Uncharacterized protein n=1 Tax=Myoviridae sp. ctMne5 TaxID=2825089 RepID=A0A8S5TZV0_9CAUD|nr:MAG TPA: hypothetical protein [Myoviridae sp. ctMne5]
MSLPEESVAVNTLPEVTTIPTGKKLIFTDPDTNEGGIITLENLTKQILQNLTTQTFGLDQGNLTLLQAINQLNSNAKYSKYSASLIQSQRIEEDTVKEITFYKFGRLVSAFINISVKAFHPSTTDFVDICDIPDDYLPTHNLIVNYVTQVGTPMLFQIHPLKKKASVYGVNELKNDWLIRQVFTYISKA